MNTDDEKKGGIFMPAWLCFLILAIGVIALVLALLVSAKVMLLNKTLQETAAATPAPVTVEAPVVPAVEPAPVQEPAPVVEQTSPPVTTATDAVPEATVVEAPVVPVQPEPAPAAKDTHYKIKWGDTLWDISNAYYKNPWLYPGIAKHNKIKNPNLIISGTFIDIPAKAQ